LFTNIYSIKHKGDLIYHNSRRGSTAQEISLVGQLVTGQTIPTGFTTNAPTVTVKPLGVVIDQVVQTVVGFISFLTNFFGQLQAQPPQQI